MKKLTALCFAAFFALSTILGSAALNSAHADCAVFQHDLSARVGSWANAVTKAADQYNDALTKLAVLNVQTPPPPDVQAQIKEKQAKISTAKEAIVRETNLLKIDLLRLTCQTTDKSEGLKLPGFINDLIKAKGLPLTKTTSVVPNFTWNVKSGTLGSLGGTLTVRFNNP